MPLLFLVSACVVQPAKEPTTPSESQVSSSPGRGTSDRIVKLENGVYMEIRPGTDPGFTHCCGDSSYMMEMDCSERLMRCYEHKESLWKQTYGKHCKRALDQACYLETCNLVCEAIASVGGQL